MSNPKSELNVSDIIKRYNNGETVRQIKSIYRTTITRISNLLKDNDVKVLSCAERRKKQIPWGEIKKRYLSGERLESICAEYKMSFRFLTKFLEEENIKIRTAGSYQVRKWNKNEIEEILKLYTIDLVSMETIARKYNVSYVAIRNLLIKNGVEIVTKLTKKRAALNEELIKLAISMLEEHFTIRQIGKYINRHPTIVSRTLKERGYIIPKFFGECSSRFSYVGWYGDWKFRSLMELSFILDNEGLNKIESAESLKIPYTYKQKNRIYHPDFLLKDKILIEIKPKCNQKRGSVLAKAKAARKFCKAKGWEYQMMEWKSDMQKIKELFIKREVSFENKEDEAVFKYLRFTKNEMATFYGENN